MTIFVDSSVWFALVVARDRSKARVKSIVQEHSDHVTTDHIVVETRLLLNSRFHRHAAEPFWERIRQSGVGVETTTAADMDAAWAIGEAFSDQDFSIVDRTSFAVMERLGITRAASSDNHFSVYRYGRTRDKAFEVIR